MKTIVLFCFVMLIASVSPQGFDMGARYFRLKHRDSQQYAEMDINKDVKLAGFNDERYEQQWYMEGLVIRNKKWPTGVLTFHSQNYIDHGRTAGKVFRGHNTHGTGDQSWRFDFEGFTWKSDKRDFRPGFNIMDIRLVPYTRDRNGRHISSGKAGDYVGGMKYDDGQASRFEWDIIFPTRKEYDGYFYIKHEMSGLVLEIDGDDFGIILQVQDPNNNDYRQQWFWDRDYLRNRREPNGVLDSDNRDYWNHNNDRIGWINRNTNEYRGDDQTWLFEDGTIKSKKNDSGVVDMSLVPYTQRRGSKTRKMSNGGEGHHVGGMKWNRKNKDTFKWTLEDA